MTEENIENKNLWNEQERNIENEKIWTDKKNNKEKTNKVNNKKLQKENLKLKKDLKEKEETLKNIQLQYISLKNEFDSFSKIVKNNENKQKEQIFEKIILKIIPILELFMTSYEHLPNEFTDHKWAEWLNIINKKINTFLDDFNIEMIQTIGLVPDEAKHEIIWTEWVEDDEEKWLIKKEIKKWYVLKNKDKEKVLTPAKVVVWQ